MTPCQENDAKNDLLKPLRQNPKRFERIMFLRDLYQAENYELRIAGGAVRDILLGNEPSDIDFATDATPNESLKVLEAHQDVLRIICTQSGKRHGTVAAKFKETTSLDIHKKQKLDNDSISTAAVAYPPVYDEESPFEITTLRCDRETDGRHAEVEFIKDWKLDAERRDLTINSMFLTLKGELIDYFNGKKDLDSGIVVFVGDADKRIKEDYLRILRFFRFWCRYGKQKPDCQTLTNIKQHIEGLKSISGERIWQETKKIFSISQCKETIKMMIDLNVTHFLGIVDDDTEDLLKSSINDLELIEENINKFKSQADGKLEKKIEELIPVIKFSSLIQTATAFENAYLRLKYSNLERDLLMFILSNRDETINLKALKYMLATSPRTEESGLRLKIKALMIHKGADIELSRELDSWDLPVFPINGVEVREKAKQHSIPMNRVKDILEYARDIWAKSDYKMDKEALIASINSKVDDFKY